MRQRSGADMKRKLKWYDLVALGVGGMLGVGVFVTTGSVAHYHSGPAVFISYIIAGISALLSSLCYTEFAVQVPVAGGAFSYLRLTFGIYKAFFFHYMEFSTVLCFVQLFSSKFQPIPFEFHLFNLDFLWML